MTSDPPVIEAMILEKEGEKKRLLEAMQRKRDKREQFAQETGCGVNVVHKMGKSELMEHLSN